MKKEELRVTFFHTVNNENLSTFTRQLATLLQAKVPLSRSLGLLFKQEKSVVLRHIISGLLNSVRSGDTFSEGLARYPKVFDPFYLNIVKAGETSGALDTVLLRLAYFLEKSGN